MVPDAVIPPALPSDLIWQFFAFSVGSSVVCYFIGIAAGAVTLAFQRRRAKGQS